MSATYDTVLLDQPILSQTKLKPELQVVYPLGTFAGTIEKVPYRCNGRIVPSDTSDQLISAGLK